MLLTENITLLRELASILLHTRLAEKDGEAGVGRRAFSPGMKDNSKILFRGELEGMTPILLRRVETVE